MYYSLRSILVATNIDVPRHILVLDTFILVTSNMNHRECRNAHLITFSYDVTSLNIFCVYLFISIGYHIKKRNSSSYGLSTFAPVSNFGMFEIYKFPLSHRVQVLSFSQ
jgi:hypothetical protein